MDAAGDDAGASVGVAVPAVAVAVGARRERVVAAAEGARRRGAQSCLRLGHARWLGSCKPLLFFFFMG